MKFIFLFFISLSTSFIFSQVIEVNYNSNKSGIASKSTSIIESDRISNMKKKMGGLFWHYTVKSDGEQISRKLDSLTQVCEFPIMSTFRYEQKQLKSNEDWLIYTLIPDEKGNNIYNVEESNTSGEWSLNHNDVKNILGYKCFKAINKDDKDKWAWFTLELPYSLSPTTQYPFPGVVLECYDGLTIYKANCVKLNTNIKNLTHFDLNDYKIIQVKNFREFGKIVSNKGFRVSTDMFNCRLNK